MIGWAEARFGTITAKGGLLVLDALLRVLAVINPELKRAASLPCFDREEVEYI
jgi:hypothetical protein